MDLRDPQSLVTEWMESGWMIGIGAAGLILILLGFKRDDVIRPIFIGTGIALAALGFGAQFAGWNPLGL